MFHKFKLALLSLFFCVLPLMGQTHIKARVDADSYKSQDIVELSIYVENNSGLHGVYFDVDYDSSVFQFLDAESGRLSRGFPNDGEFLYAATPLGAGNTSRDHVVVSYAVNGYGSVIYNTGLLARLRFRVKDHIVDPARYFQFDFTERGVIDGSGNPLPGVFWSPSRSFQTESLYGDSFIQIQNPYYHATLKKESEHISVVKKETGDEVFILVDTLFSTGTGDHKVKIYNDAQPEIFNIYDGASGSLNDSPVSVKTGYNRIIAELLNVDHTKIVMAETVFYLAPDSEAVKIVSPSAHAFLNGDMVEVKVETPYTGVRINHQDALLDSTLTDSEGNLINIYTLSVWLQKGFNTIRAEVDKPKENSVPGDPNSFEEVVYSDEIEVYYRKNSDHFKLITPSMGEVFRMSQTLTVKGEIQSRFQNRDKNNGAVENSVTIEVLFTPDDFTKAPVTQVIPAVIQASEAGQESITSNYYFTADVDVSSFGSGTLQIDVYKNRVGSVWEDKVSRICYINNDPLKIELKQPNVYSVDVLDTQKKIDFFDTQRDIQAYGPQMISPSVKINETGGFEIASTTVISEIINDKVGIIDIAESPDGTLYALENINGSMTIYQKKLNDELWTEVVTRSGLFAFDLEYTEKGLFIGVSHLYGSESDGLYLLDDGKLWNVALPGALPHVQFLNSVDGELYIYGNFYSSLYSFNVHTLAQDGEVLQVSGVNSFELRSSRELSQFILADDGKTAVLRDQFDNIEFYTLVGSGYEKALISGSSVTGEWVSAGEYSTGEYTAFLILSSGVHEVVMKDRRTGQFYRQDFILNTSLAGTPDSLAVEFKEDSFHFVYSVLNEYHYLKGQIFFDRFYKKDEAILGSLVVASPSGTYPLLAGGDSFYFNYGLKKAPGTYLDPLVHFYYKFTESASAQFSYSNDDSEGLTGFSFEVEPEWMNQEVSSISLGFSVKSQDSSGDLTVPRDLLSQFKAEGVLVSGEYYNTSVYFDADAGRYRVEVDFLYDNTLPSSVDFDFLFQSVGNSSPRIYNLAVKKKVPVTLAVEKKEGQLLEIPVQGYIADRTVTQVRIGSTWVPVERDGSFYYKYRVDSVQDSVDIELFCQNDKEETSTSFTVNIIDSKNGLKNIEFFDREASVTPLVYQNGGVSLTTDALYVSGNYFGLEGVFVGFKTYTTDSDKPVLLHSGIFKTTEDSDYQMLFNDTGIEPGDRNFQGGSFTYGKIPLEPGAQKVVVYTENPDGKRVEYLLNGLSPVVSYEMPADQMGLVFYNGTDITENSYNMEFVKEITLPVQENPGINGYEFSADFTISGKVSTLYHTNLIVKSYNPGLVFSNGLDEVIVTLEPGNKFEIPVKITMDSAVEKDFYIGFIPDSPLLSRTRRGLIVHAYKSFVNTNFVPDFSEITEAGIISDSDTQPYIPIRFSFNREDIPRPGYTKAVLTLNYEKEFSGWVTEDVTHPGVYYLEGEDEQPVVLTGFKKGMNRLSWKLYYKEAGKSHLGVMSSSTLNKAGMEDYFFSFKGFETRLKTEVFFSSPLRDRLYGTGTDAVPLPTLSISRDSNVMVSLYLNGKELDVSSLWTLNGSGKGFSDYSFPLEYLIQGRNELVVYEDESESFMESYSFLYDNQTPEVTLESYRYSADHTNLTHVSFLVKEANYKSARLYFNGTVSPDYPAIEILRRDQYRVIWKNLNNVVNSSLSPVYIVVEDLTGKSSASEGVPLLNNLNRPVTDAVRDETVTLPVFTGSETIPNEAGIQMFSEHTKYAPGSYLTRTDMTDIYNSDMVLINKYYSQKILAQNDGGLDGVANDNFSFSVDIKGDILVIGSPQSDSQLANSGAVYVYSRMEDDSWRFLQKLTANDKGTADRFGEDVAVNDNYIAVSAVHDNDHGDNSGSVYIFKRDQNSNWVQVNKIVPSDGAFGDNFGSSIEMDNNYLIVGADHDDESTGNCGSAYIYSIPTWELMDKITASDADASDFFGVSVAVAGNVALVGAFEDDQNGGNAGAAYIFTLENGKWVQKKKLVAFDGITSDIFGYRVAASDTVLVVSALYDDDGGSATGSVYLYEKNIDGEWVFSAKLTASDKKSNDFFGESLAVEKDTVVVGARLKDSLTGADTGGAYVYEKIDGSWTETHIIESFDPVASDQLGKDVGFSNNLVVAGSWYDDDQGASSGSALLIDIDKRDSVIHNKNNEKYLVFKMDAPSLSFSDFQSLIQFEIFAREQNLTDLSVREVAAQAPLTLKPDSYKYLQLDTEYFYVVDVYSLIEQYQTAIYQFKPSSGYLLLDKGSLRLKYNKDFKFEGKRPGEIYFTGDSSHNWNDLRFFHDGYLDVNGNISLTHTGSGYTYSRTSDTDDMTLSFWLRVEEEGFGTQSFNDFYSDADRRVLKLPGVELGYNKGRLDLYRSLTSTPFASFNVNNLDNWNQIHLTVSRSGETKLYFNGVLLGSVNLTLSECQALLAQNAVYDFSPDTSFAGGFYSLARVVFIDKLLLDTQIQRNHSLGNELDVAERTFQFSNTSVFTVEEASLRALGPNLEEHIDNTQDSDWSDINGGALKASQAKGNLLKVSSRDGINSVILKSSGLYTIVNADVEGGVDSFSIKPLNSTGRYYFGDRVGNGGLKTDYSYTVSGFVSYLEPGTEARLVLRINNREESLALSEGPFRLNFENTTLEIPEIMNLYVETSGKITFKHNMTFNEGDFILKKDLIESAASAKNVFDVTGSISFWYKPLFSNSQGAISHSITLFDSEFFKVGAHSLAGDDARYYVTLKKHDGTTVSWSTNKAVEENWQFFQLSWDLEQGVLDLYINGEQIIAAENILFDIFGSMTGSYPVADNIFIGCSQNKTQFAEGFIDKFFISRYFSRSLFSFEDMKYRFFSLEYNESENLIDKKFTTIQAENEFLKAEAIGSLEFEITNMDGAVVQKGRDADLPLSLKSLPGGRYRVKALMTLNGREYLFRNSFNINNRPKFTLKKQTALIFKEKENDLEFVFSYDRSYQLETDQRIFAGVALKVTYNNESYNYYLVQDFYNNDTTRWLMGKESVSGDSVVWEPVSINPGGDIPLTIQKVCSSSEVLTEFKYFYLEGAFNKDRHSFDVLPGELQMNSVIPVATVLYEIKKHNGIEYKINVNLGMPEIAGDIPDETLGQIKIVSVMSLKGQGSVSETIHSLNPDGSVDLYYDDILVRDSMGKPVYGEYSGNLKLNLQNTNKNSIDIVEGLKWSKVITAEEELVSIQEVSLKVNELSLLYMNKEDSDAKALFRIKYYASGVPGIINTVLEVLNDKGLPVGSPVITAMTSSSIENTWDFENVIIPPGNHRVKVTLSSGTLTDSYSMEISNDPEPVEVFITNDVESEITYNNLYFSWKGTYDSSFHSEITYQYQIDDRGWSDPRNDVRDVRFFNLDEGYHTFQVKASFRGKVSPVVSRTFFVDVHRPVFHKEKISTEEIRNREDVLTGVKITGEAGAVEDISLKELYIQGEAVKVNGDGSFVSHDVVLNKDGVNEILLTAVDKVGNFSDLTLKVDNFLTSVDFPDVENPVNTEYVQYSPLVLTGKIQESITADMEIFLKDPFTPVSDDLSSWKKARINEDRTFFVEDVLIHAGSETQVMVSTVTLALRFSSGEVFYRDIELKAREILVPIEMNLSTRAAEGENEDTYVEISCKANVEGISSWSIDYNGDGIYDDIDVVQNSNSEAVKTHSWTHKYSGIDMFHPRVRIITERGEFFSIADTLIIHEKIKDASPSQILNPVSMSSVKTSLETHKVYILREEMGEKVIDIYFIPKYNTWLQNTGERIHLKQLGSVTGFKGASIIKAVDEKTLFIVDNYQGTGRLYQLRANDFGNFSLVNAQEPEAFASYISDIVVDQSSIYLTFEGNGQIVTLDLDGEGLIVPASGKTHEVAALNTRMPGNNGHITAGSEGLIFSDYYNNRILSLGDSFKALEQFGSLGNEGGEFLKPSLIASHNNRILVYDEMRQDIQVFDSEFNEQSTLKYNPSEGYQNYVDSLFFQDVTAVDLISKEEGDRLYYYALILSRSKGQLSLLKLPRYEELRARVRNNRIAYIKEGEVFSSKPDGSDMLRLLSTDSIPKIEGTLDYPALSPDGKTLVFTSRVKLYNSGYHSDWENQSISDYDNLYTVDLETQDLKKIDLGILNNYSIERPVFNSNGDRIIFSAKSPGEKWQIWVYNIKDGGVEKLFTSDENVRYPYYSPDDRFVVFTTDYDGDEDIEIIDTENTTVRTVVTSNSARDSLPVWSVVYPGEITNPDLKVESKISFVSEKDFHKGVYVVYMSRPDASDIRVFDKKTGTDASDVEGAAIELTSVNTEGDYPCFTGDGKNLFFEYFDGTSMSLKKFSFELNEAEMVKPAPDFVYEEVDGLYGARRPAGMKNAITNFFAENVNGDEIALSWDRYTKTDIFYTVQLIEPRQGGDILIEKKVSSQEGTSLKGLTPGYKYSIRVMVLENGKEVTTSQWKEVKIPNVISRPSYTINEKNPYVVDFSAWAPANTDKTGWKYKWIIDNTVYDAGESRNFSFEFATSGNKIVQLRVDGTNDSGAETAISEPFEVEIISDIIPVINKTVSDDGLSLILDASNSLGEKINYSSVLWTLSGSGAQPQSLKGMTREFDISGYGERVYVTLALERVAVNGQVTTDIIEKNECIDVGIREVIPVIDTRVSESNERLLIFDGSQSLGNINWHNAQWSLMANGAVIHQVHGVSSFNYFFPESNREVLYSVTLTAPKKSDGTSVTSSKIISVEPAPIEPEIEYQVLESGVKDGQISSAKLVLDCTGSKGSNIDFSQAKWTIPTASGYGEQPTQFGPTAVFTLNNIGKGAVVEVNLALAHRGASDYVTVTKLISIDADTMPVSELYVNSDVSETSEGQVVNLDVYNSTGGNIDWEKTSWNINVPGMGPMNFRGPQVSVPVGALSEDGEITYSCTLYRLGGAVQSKEGRVPLQAQIIEPLILFNNVSRDKNTGDFNRYYEMNVLETKGANIDWERTEWYIYDGSGAPVIKRGSSVAHYFPENAKSMGYPVYVKMYHKGYSYAFTGYKSLDIEGDVVEPVITMEFDNGNPNIVRFSAKDSAGNNIKWNNTKWTFGDSSQPAYGAEVEHVFPAKSEGKTYRVTLTLTRVMYNGAQEETFTVTKDIVIGADRIKAVVKASVTDGFLVLSAAESEGQGLLLDRSSWFFPGEGDSSSVSDHIESGTIQRENSNIGVDWFAKVRGGYGYGEEAAGTGFIRAEAGVQGGGGYHETKQVIIPNSDYINRNDAFSSQNIHTGVVCRRSVGNEKYITVALTVFRMTADGGSEAETVTVKVDLEKAKTRGTTSGVVYGR